MKRRFSINISGSQFQIEDDAYEILKIFLNTEYKTTNKSYSGSGTANNSLEDRLAKLLNKLSLNGQNALTIDMVNEAVELIKTDNDKVETEISDINETKTYQEEEPQKTKKLYRDPDSRIFGGVCSGLSHYFLFDKALVRVLFVILFFITSGAALLAYVILWIAAPLANTPDQKREMTQPSNKPKNIADKEQQPYKNDKASRPYYKDDRLNNQRKSNADNVIGKIFGIFFLIIGFTLLIVLIAGIVFSLRFMGIIPFISDGLFFNHLVSESFATTLLLSLLCIIGIPLFLIIYAGIKLSFNYVANSKAVFNTALGAWIIALIIFIGSVTGAVKNLRNDSVQTSSMVLEQSDLPLLVKINEEFDFYSEYKFQFNNYKIAVFDQKEHIVARPSLSIGKTYSDDVRLRIRKTEKGKTTYFEKNNIIPIEINIENKGNQLIIDPYFVLKAGEKWRMQKIDITLELPVGKIIYIDENMYPILKDAKNQDELWAIDLVGSYWVMEPDGLKKIESINK